MNKLLEDIIDQHERGMDLSTSAIDFLIQLVKENYVPDVELKLFEELETDTDISWWNENREKINTVIRMCNKWQEEEKLDRYYGQLVIAKCNSIREQDDSILSGWQLDILDEIEEHVKKTLEVIK